MFLKRKLISITSLAISVLVSACSSGAANQPASKQVNYLTFSKTGVIPVFYDKTNDIKILVSNNTSSDINNLEFDNMPGSPVMITGCETIKAHTDCILTAHVDLQRSTNPSLSYMAHANLALGDTLASTEHLLEFQGVADGTQPGVYLANTFIENNSKSTTYLYATGTHDASYDLHNTAFVDHESAIINHNELTKIKAGEIVPVYIDGTKLTPGNVRFLSDIMNSISRQITRLDQLLNVTAPTKNKAVVVSFTTGASVINITGTSAVNVFHTIANSGNVPVTISRGDIESALSFGIESVVGLDYGTCFRNEPNNILESGSRCTVNVTLKSSSQNAGAATFKVLADYKESGSTTQSVTLTQYVGWQRTITNGRVVLSSPIQTVNIGVETSAATTVKIDNLSNQSVNIQNLVVTTSIPANTTLNWSSCQTIAANSSCQASLTIRGNGTNYGTSSINVVATVNNGSTTYNSVLRPITGNLADDRKALTSFAVYGGSSTIDNTANTITLNLPYETWLTDPTGHAAIFNSTGNKVLINGVEQISGVTKNDYLARYGNPATGFTKPFIISVVAKDGSKRDYTLIANPNLIDFRKNTFYLPYTSDPSNVKFYQSSGYKIAIDPATKQLTTYLPNGEKFLQVDALSTYYVMFQDDNNFVGYGNGSNNNSTFETKAQWGNGIEFVLYGSDFFLQDNGRSDIQVSMNDGYSRGIVCDSWGARRCISVTRFPRSDEKTLTSFVVYGGSSTIDNTANTITLNLPYETVVSAGGDAATFSFAGSKVLINGVEQISGVTKNDYLARYGNPATGVIKPFIISVIAKDGSKRDYTIIANPQLVQFKRDAFYLPYTSDTNNVKIYQSRDCKMAIDPTSKQLTTYLLRNNSKFLQLNPLITYYLMFQNNGDFVGYGNGTNNNSTIITKDIWGAGQEFVLYGCDFFVQDNGRSDLQVTMSDGYSRGLICSTLYENRQCAPMTRFQ